MEEIDIDEIHDILTDLICSCMKYVPYQKPNIGDWCFEYSSRPSQNRDSRIGVLLKEISIETGEFITRTIGGKEVHWKNASIQKIPCDLLRQKNIAPASKR